MENEKGHFIVYKSYMIYETSPILKFKGYQITMYKYRCSKCSYRYNTQSCDCILSAYHARIFPPFLLTVNMLNSLFLFMIHHNRLHFPSPELQLCTSPHYPLRSFHHNNFLIPTPRTSAFKNSFFPSAICLLELPSSSPKRDPISLPFQIVHKEYRFYMYLNHLCCITL